MNPKSNNPLTISRGFPNYDRNVQAQEMQVADTSQSVWSISTGDLVNTQPVRDNGTLFYCTIDSKAGKGFLHSVDIEQGLLNWSFEVVDIVDSNLVITSPAVYGSMVYFGIYAPQDSDFTIAIMYGIDINSGAVGFTYQTELVGESSTITSPAFQNGNVIFGLGIKAGQPYIPKYIAVNSEGEIQWTEEAYGDLPAALNDTPCVFTPTVIGNSIAMVFNLGGILNGVLTIRTEDGTSINSFGSYSYFSTAPVFTGTHVACGCYDGSLKSFALSDEGTDWSTEAGLGSVNGTPAFYNGVIYFADGERLRAYNATTGVELWQRSLQDEILTSIIAETGAIYCGTNEAVFAVSSESKGQVAVEYKINQGGVALGPTVLNSRLYFWNRSSDDTGKLQGVDFLGTLNQFTVDANLMVENYDAEGNPTETPAFRTTMQIVDTKGNARPEQCIKVWCSAVVTDNEDGGTLPITVSGIEYIISPTKHEWLEADGSGLLTISTPASSLTTPGLELWANFMSEEFKVLIWPDTRMIDHLSVISGDELLVARSYDGEEILREDYTTENAEENSDAIASAIRYSLGGQDGDKTSFITRTAIDQSGKLYVTYPDQEPQVQSMSRSADSTRAYQGQDVNWNLALSDDSASFQEIDAATAAARNTLEAINIRRRAAGRVEINIFGDAIDWAKDLGKGIVKVIDVGYEFLEGVTRVTIEAIESAYQFDVISLDDAINVIRGIVDTVMKLADYFLQWLSFLFEWPDIIDTQGYIKSTVKQGFREMKTWAETEGAEDLRSLFNVENMTSAFNETMSKIGKTTIEEATESYNDPLSYFNMGKANSYTQSMWLVEKALQYMPDVVSTIPNAQADLDKAVAEFIEEVLLVITDQFSNMIFNYAEFFQSLLDNVEDFVELDFDEVFAGVEALIAEFVVLLDKLAESFLRLLENGIDPMIDVLDNPIKVPFLSDLYKLISGGKDLTTLNLVTLILAVPTTLTYKANNDGKAPKEPKSQNSVLFLENNKDEAGWDYYEDWFGYALFGGGIFAGLLSTADFFNSWNDEAEGVSDAELVSILQGIVIGFSALMVPFWISIVVHEAEEKEKAWLGGMVLGGLSAIGSIVSLGIYGVNAELRSKGEKPIRSDYFQFTLGCIGIPLNSFFAIYTPRNFYGPSDSNPMYFLANLFGLFPNLVSCVKNPKIKIPVSGLGYMVYTAIYGIDDVT